MWETVYTSNCTENVYFPWIVDAGLAVVELFTTKCTLWANCLGIDNDRLTYSYYVASKNEKVLLPMYSGPNSTVNVFFPIGNEDENYQNQLTVIASNDANYTASLTVYPITVSQHLVIFC